MGLSSSIYVAEGLLLTTQFGMSIAATGSVITYAGTKGAIALSSTFAEKERKEHDPAWKTAFFAAKWFSLASGTIVAACGAAMTGSGAFLVSILPIALIAGAGPISTGVSIAVGALVATGTLVWAARKVTHQAQAISAAFQGGR